MFRFARALYTDNVSSLVDRFLRSSRSGVDTFVVYRSKSCGALHLRLRERWLYFARGGKKCLHFSDRVMLCPDTCQRSWYFRAVWWNLSIFASTATKILKTSV